MLQTSFTLTNSQEDGYRAFAGDAIFRLSVGIEIPADLCADFDRVLRS